jgi:hypothetical protein
MKELSLVEGGAWFEVFGGPRSIQRLDWTRQGAIRSIVRGDAGGENAEVLIRRADHLIRAHGRITLLHDFWELTSFGSAFRVELVRWGQTNPNRFDAVRILTRSKIVNMGVAVMNQALGGIVTTYGMRAEFDIVAKKLGFPLFPAMPALG